MILVLDNYDSFTWNLVQLLGELGAEVECVRNDAIDLAEIERRRPTKLIISPGPCAPDQAGVSVAAIKAFSGRIPVLGVCLGHQCIGQAFGGRVVRAGRVMHGKTSTLRHDGTGLFSGVPVEVEVGRYHSLVVEQSSLPECLVPTAFARDDSEVMALRHRVHPTVGLQFHPESVLTPAGRQMVANFLEGRC